MISLLRLGKRKPRLGIMQSEIKQKIGEKTNQQCLYCGCKMQFHSPEKESYASIEHFIEKKHPFSFLREEEPFLFLACKKCNNKRGGEQSSPINFGYKKKSPFLSLIGKTGEKIKNYVQSEFSSFLREENPDLGELRALLRDINAHAIKEEKKLIIGIIEQEIYKKKLCV